MANLVPEPQRINNNDKGWLARTIINGIHAIFSSAINKLEKEKINRSEMADYGYGIKRYKDPVSTITNLPKTGNEEGDGRVVLDDLDPSGKYAYVHLWDGKKWGKTPLIILSSDVATTGGYDGTLKDISDKVDNIGIWSEDNEFIRIWSDNDGKILGGIRADGTWYIPLGIPDEVRTELNKLTQSLSSLIGIDKLTEILDGYIKKKDGYDLIAKDFSDMISVPDSEEFINIEIDSDNKILSYRDASGKKYEPAGVSTPEIEITKKLNLSSEALTDLGERLKIHGGIVGDWSGIAEKTLPSPDVASIVNITVDSLPTTKDKKDAVIEYWDKYGNYFKEDITIAAQGTSSMAFAKKNFSIKFKNCKIRFGTGVLLDSYQLKAYYIDSFIGQCIVSFRLCEQIYNSRNRSDRYPFSHVSENNSPYFSKGILDSDFSSGATTIPQGFPCVVHHNSDFQGCFAFAYPKDRDNYNLKKSDSNHILLDGAVGKTEFFNGTIDWSMFEIRNPKDLKNINEKKYKEGDELSQTDPFSLAVRDNMQRFSSALSTIAANGGSKADYEQYFNIGFCIDYMLHANFSYNYDGLRKNWLWTTWDGKLWSPCFWDHDSIFGMFANGGFVLGYSTTHILTGGNVLNFLSTLYKPEMDARYKELRDSGIFSTSNVVDLYTNWVRSMGLENYKQDFAKWNPPSYRANNVNDGWVINEWVLATDAITYDPNKQYNIGDTCIFGNNVRYRMRCVSPVKGVPPTNSGNIIEGFYNSVDRVRIWTDARLETLDNYFNYN